MESPISYTLMAIENGMIGITGTNARPSIAPTFGVENMLGINPLTFGMPSDEDFSFVLDCATSVAQRGKIEYYSRIGKTMPQGWVIGEDGGGYKGYGYATVVEILSAALQSGAFLKALNGAENGKTVPYNLGHFFMAVDISSFTELNLFKKSTGEILRQLRASKKRPGKDRIYTAGEKEYLAWLSRKDKGVPLDEVVIKEVLELQKEFNLDKYKFPF